MSDLALALRQQKQEQATRAFPLFRCVYAPCRYIGVREQLQDSIFDGVIIPVTAGHVVLEGVLHVVQRLTEV